MQPLTILTIGSVKNKHLKAEIDDLKKRIHRLSIVELKEVKVGNSGTIEQIKQKECVLIEQYLASLSGPRKVFLMTEFGKTYSTEQFYSKISKSDEELIFVICGPFGPSEKLKKIVGSHISLSPLTFTHEMALLVLVEQLYRIQTIESGKEYHK